LVSEPFISVFAVLYYTSAASYRALQQVQRLDSK